MGPGAACKEIKLTDRNLASPKRRERVPSPTAFEIGGGLIFKISQSPGRAEATPALSASRPTIN